MNDDQQPPFIPAWMRGQNWSPHQWAIYCYIASRGECWATKRTMAKDLHMSKDTLIREVEEMVRCGWLEEIDPGPNRSKTYKAKTGGKPLVRLKRRSPKYKTCPYVGSAKLDNPAVSGPKLDPTQGQHLSLPKDSTCPYVGSLKYTKESTPKKEEKPDLLAKVKDCLKGGDLRSAIYFGGKSMRGGNRDC